MESIGASCFNNKTARCFFPSGRKIVNNKNYLSSSGPKNCSLKASKIGSSYTGISL